MSVLIIRIYLGTHSKFGTDWIKIGALETIPHSAISKCDEQKDGQITISRSVQCHTSHRKDSKICTALTTITKKT